MPSLPILYLQPNTCVMVADYHANADNYEDAIDWHRTAIVLSAVEKFNRGELPEVNLRNQLHLAFRGSDDDIEAHAASLTR